MAIFIQKKEVLKLIILIIQIKTFKEGMSENNASII